MSDFASSPVSATPMPDWQLEQMRRWCADPRSEDEFGYDCARYLLAEVDRLRAIISGHAPTPDLEPVIMPDNPPDMILAWLSDLRGHHTQSEHANAGRRRYALMRAEIAALAQGPDTSTTHKRDNPMVPWELNCKRSRR